MNTRSTRVLAILSLVLMLTGCETGGQTGALAGGGIGALAGQAIGGDTGATLIGAAAGAGIGYIIGNEHDKKEAKKAEGQHSPTYMHTQVDPLGGTRWVVASLAPRDAVPPYVSKIVEFRPYGRAITTTTLPNGHVEVVDEKYRVVGDALIVNRPGFMINAQFSIEGDEMIVNADKFRAVLKRVP